MYLVPYEYRVLRSLFVETALSAAGPTPLHKERRDSAQSSALSQLAVQLFTHDLQYNGASDYNTTLRTGLRNMFCQFQLCTLAKTNLTQDLTLTPTL